MNTQPRSLNTLPRSLRTLLRPLNTPPRLPLSTHPAAITSSLNLRAGTVTRLLRAHPTLWLSSLGMLVGASIDAGHAGFQLLVNLCANAGALSFIDIMRLHWLCLPYMHVGMMAGGLAGAILSAPALTFLNATAHQRKIGTTTGKMQKIAPETAQETAYETTQKAAQQTVPRAVPGTVPGTGKKFGPAAGRCGTGLASTLLMLLGMNLGGYLWLRAGLRLSDTAEAAAMSLAMLAGMATAMQTWTWANRMPIFVRRLRTIAVHNYRFATRRYVSSTNDAP